MDHDGHHLPMISSQLNCWRKLRVVETTWVNKMHLLLRQNWPLAHLLHPTHLTPAGFYEQRARKTVCYSGLIEDGPEDSDHYSQSGLAGWSPGTNEPGSHERFLALRREVSQKHVVVRDGQYTLSGIPRDLPNHPQLVPSPVLHFLPRCEQKALWDSSFHPDVDGRASQSFLRAHVHKQVFCVKEQESVSERELVCQSVILFSAVPLV